MGSRRNGVAIVSRVGLDNVERGFPGMPGFPSRRPVRSARTAAGSASTACTFPTGASRPDHYRYKLDWLAALRDVVAADRPTALCGDMNIAPTDADV